MRSVVSKRGLQPKPCPNCRSSNVRRSRRRTLREWWRSFFGKFNFRCLDCGTRFEEAILDERIFKYAYCPACHRLDLSSWNPENYHVSWWHKLRLQFGAKPYRCEPCRRNFTSFRPRAERYKRVKSGKSAETAAAGGSETTQARVTNATPADSPSGAR